MFSLLLDMLPSIQVKSYLGWLDWLRSQATAAGKEPVFINLDETSIACSWPQVRGNIVKPKLWLCKKQGPSAKAKLKTIRSAVTHVALISDRPDIQALLPQIFIGNEVAFPAAAMDVSQKPVVVQYWRNKSSWNSVELMQRVLRELAASLAARSNLQPILIMDAASIHLHTSVLEQGMKSNIWLACVPAGLTWLLQPLDTHVFALYKAWLRNQFRALRSQGLVSCQQWLHLLGRGATTFLAGRRWRRAFESAGIMGSKQRLSSALKEYFCEAGHGSAAAPVPPSETDLQLILPRGRKTHRTLWTFKPSGRKRYLFLTWQSGKKKKISSSSTSG